MKTYSCIIVDDEPKAIELLSESISSLYTNIEVSRTHTNWKDALDSIKHLNFDLLFLDVSMPEKTGMDILNLVPNLKSELIFVTAYTEYAVDAFQYGACGYVLKPIKDDVLSHTIDNAIKKLEQKKLAEQGASASLAKAKIAIPNNNGIDYITVEDIIYLEANSRYTRIVLKDKELLCSYNLGKFKQLLENHSFYQVHRSYMVNLNFIMRYKSSGTIVMSPGYEIPIAKNTRDDFFNLFLKVTREA